MGRSLECQTQATTTTTTTLSAHATMENATPESPTPDVDQKGPELDVGRATPSVPTSPVPDSNGDASSTPRLASFAGLIMGQKSQPWNSTPSESATPMSPSTTDSDQATPYFTRPARFLDDEDTGPRRTASFGSTVASTLNAHRRAANLVAGGSSPGGSAGGLTETDLRRFVFHHQRAKRLVSGLRVHAFTRQAFVSSFTVGLAIGSVVAIVLKIMKDIASRMLYS